MSREIIRLAVILYVRFPLFLHSVEDLLHKCGIDVSYEAARYWWGQASCWEYPKLCV
ncbi:MAG: putative transposase [Dinoroseobacter sp.]|jgi:putative transposase